MPENSADAPGRPGIPARWTSSAKSGVGTALGSMSRVWFTLSHGILNEVYYPGVDQACLRDMGLIVTDGRAFSSEEKRDAGSVVGCPAPGVPAYHLTNTCRKGRYRIEKQLISDPVRDAVLQSTKFVPLQGKLADYHLHVMLAPHLGNQGAGNTAWVGDHKGVPMLFASRNGLALAVACSAPWLKRSVGFAGLSDGYQELQQHKRLSTTWTRAENGNVALVGEIDLLACDGSFVLALGFGHGPDEAGHRARAALLDGFDDARETYVAEWQEWLKTLEPSDGEDANPQDLYRTSMAVMRIHESKNLRGGTIASLSIPWGFSKGDGDLGGYHLVWPRDLAETAGGLLAGGADEDARRVLSYLALTQNADGHWAQNMWLNGSPYWNGVQMDETAMPILLVDLARRNQALGPDDVAKFWPMVRKAAAFLVQNGPVTPEDRWEEDGGYSPFTLATEIAALLVAADFADMNEETAVGVYLREVADVWNDHVERWIYATGTPLAKEVGVEGYYIRISPPETSDAPSPTFGFVPIKNRPPGQNSARAVEIVSPDALALVRFGLRSATDPRIVNTVRVIDRKLKVDTPNGPGWRRYNEDGYGEHADGSPYDGTGIGRLWPLLSGERAHYELAAGRPKQALELMRAMERFANDGGLIPEQVWDQPDMPERELYFGKPSGSAMPLVWAHAEYVKLRRSLRDGRAFDTPPQTVQRYQKDQIASRHAIWRFNHKCRSIPAGKVLRIEVRAEARVHWGRDGWQGVRETSTRDTALGIHLVDLPTTHFPGGTKIDFTFFWIEAGDWEGRDFQVEIEASTQTDDI